MGPKLTLAVRIALGSVLTCAGIASGQNGSASLPGGAASTSSAAGSGGFGAVNYSVSGSLPDVSAGSSVQNVVVNATPLAVLTSDLSGSKGGGRSAASYGSASRMGMSLNGGNPSSSTSASGSSRSAASRSTSMNTLHASASLSASGASRSLHSGRNIAAMESSLTGHALESSLAEAGLSTAQEKAQSNQDDAASSGSGSGSGSRGGRYTSDFPDSTRNTAVISPPSIGNNDPFPFDPSLSDEFPDLADYQFLRPTLHVGPGAARGRQQKEDLYRQIQRRLTEYREAETPKKSFTTEKSRTPSAFGNPFGSKPSAEDKLNQLSNPGSSF